MRLVAVVLLVAGLAGCGGSGKRAAAPEDVLRTAVGRLGKGRVSCDLKSACTVIVPTPLHSNYEGFLLAMPLFDLATSDPNLAGVSRLTLTMNDDKSGQVFSISCATKDLKRPLTTDGLRSRCHSIYL